MKRNILLHPDPRLKKPCASVTEITDDLRSLADDMLATMYDAPGIGLAAPQIGVLNRLIVMDCIIPDQYADVTRPADVDVRWIDRDGKEHTETFTKLWATCVQHEIDHLDGKLFIDYLKPLRRQMITRKMTKLKRELARE